MEQVKAAGEPEAAITIRHVSRVFPVTGGEFQALTDINAEIPAGVLAILKGRSGSGKTTLLNIVGALDTPTSGSVWIGGQDVCRLSERARENLRRKQVGFVFQAVSLIPTMNAFQNVEFSLRLAGVKKGRAQRVEECLKLVGLGNRMQHMPAEMSGGEQQRVAIARAIAHRPRILLADEPTAELDSAMAAEVARLFRELTRRERVTVVMTTHDTGLMDAGDLVIELENGRQVTGEQQETER
ncbi:MAG: ABC transporter ATP-binding protein [Lachnospiraceae bacterium]|nr:ABC transporter ATP-binding protein [Lachnospiraceae bacterium]